MILYRLGRTGRSYAARHVLQHRQTKLLAQWDDIKVGGGLSIIPLVDGTAEQGFHQRHGTPG